MFGSAEGYWLIAEGWPADSLRTSERDIGHGAKSPSGNAPLAAAPPAPELELALALTVTPELTGGSSIGVAIGLEVGVAFSVEFGVDAGVDADAALGVELAAAMGVEAAADVPTALTFGCGAAVSFARSAGASAMASASAAIICGPNPRMRANLNKFIAASSVVPNAWGIFLGQYRIRAPASREPCNTPTKRDGTTFIAENAHSVGLNFDSQRAED